VVDAVQASKFIKKKKSEELVRRIGMLTSEHNAGYLNRKVYIRNRIKSSNDSIYAKSKMMHWLFYSGGEWPFQPDAEWSFSPAANTVFSHTV